MVEKSPDEVARTSFKQKYETVLINKPFRKATLDDDTLSAVKAGKGFLFISDTEVGGEGAKKHQTYNRRLLEYVMGGVLSYSIAFDESNSTITASVCDSENPNNIVYMGRIYSEAMAAIDEVGI